MQLKHLLKMVENIDPETYIKIAILDDGNLETDEGGKVIVTSCHVLNILEDTTEPNNTVNAFILSNARGTADSWELADGPTLAKVLIVPSSEKQETASFEVSL